MGPRFNKDMEGGNKPPEKKVKYLRLGYTSTPEKRQEKPKQKKKKEKPKETEERCCGEPGDGCCCGEE